MELHAAVDVEAAAEAELRIKSLREKREIGTK